MTFDAEALKQQMPYYLTADPAQKELVSGLKSLTAGATEGYFFAADEDPYTNEMLQGDGWRGFQVFSFTSGDRNMARGIVLCSASTSLSGRDNHLGRFEADGVGVG